MEINRELNDQNQRLDEMELDFGSVGALMKGVATKLDRMMGRGSSRHMCYLALFMVVVFLVIYWVMRSR